MAGLAPIPFRSEPRSSAGIVRPEGRAVEAGEADPPKRHLNCGRYPGRFNGGVAQLVERYVRNVEVGGSSPLTSTRVLPGQGFVRPLCRRRRVVDVREMSARRFVHRIQTV